MLKSALEENHKDIYQWFLMHQECLLLGHGHYAQASLEVFTQLLEAHVAFENSHLLSSGAGTDFGRMRWAASVYRQEHEKILQLAGAVECLFTRWHAEERSRTKRLLLLELLERQLTLRHVIEHHEQREEQDLFGFIVEDSAQWRQIEGLLAGYTVLKREISEFLSRS